MALYALGHLAPQIDAEAFVHPDATVIGNVVLGPGVTVWPQAVLRGDQSRIVVGARTSVQDGAVLLVNDSNRNLLVAYDLDDKPLSSEHGGPVRLYVAPMYGYKSCKWLDTIELTASVEPGYWENNGYDVDGWVGASNGRDDEPIS